MFFCLSSFGKRTAFFLLALFFLFKPAFSQSEVTVVTIISANYSEYKKNENTSEDEIHLSGNVKLSVEKEKSKTEIKADDVTFNRSTQMLYAKGNVRILKSGTSGDEQEIQCGKRSFESSVRLNNDCCF